MMDQIKINRNGEEFGPYPAAQVTELVNSGQLVATDLAWWEGMPDWRPLGELPEFSGLFATAPAPTAQPQTGAVATTTAEGPGSAGAGQPMVTIDRNGTRFGPFPLGDLDGLIAAGRLGASDQMWTEGMSEWMALGSHPEFGARFTGQTAPAAAAPAGGETNATQRYLAELEKRKQGRGKSKGRRKGTGAAHAGTAAPPKRRRGLVVAVVGIVLLGALWAGATAFFGSAAAGFFRDELAGIGTSAGAGVLRLERGEYGRGLLSSEATTSVSAANAPLGGSLQLKHRIYHGPIAFTPDGVKLVSNYIVTTWDRSAGDPAMRERVQKAFGGAEPVTLTMSVGLGGGGALKVTVPPCEFQTPAGDAGEGALLRFAGLDGAVSTRGEQGEGTVEIGALDFEGGDGALRIAVAGGNISVDAREIRDGVMIDGLVAYKFPEVAVDVEGGSFKVQDITVDQESNHEDGKIGSRTAFAVRAVELPDAEEFAELRQIVGAGGRIEFGFRGIDADAFRAVLGELENIEQSVSGPGAIDPATLAGAGPDEEVGVDRLAQQFTGLVQAGSGFWLNSQIGSTRFDLDLEYTGAVPLSELEDPEAFLTSLEGALDLRIDKAILPAEAAGEIFAGLVEQGVLTDRPMSYEASIAIGGGQLTLNGEPADLEELLAPPPPPEFDLEGLEGLDPEDLEDLEELMREEAE